MGDLEGGLVKNDGEMVGEYGAHSFFYCNVLWPNRACEIPLTKHVRAGGGQR